MSGIVRAFKVSLMHLSGLSRFPVARFQVARFPVARIAVAAIALGTALPAHAQVPIISPGYGAPPAPSEMTVRLLAVARPTVDFLERSSVLAQAQAGSRRLRAFAAREARDQAAAADALAAVAAPTLVGHDPLDAAAVGAASVDEGAETILSRLPPLLRTPGARSVAADQAIAAAGAADLAQLAGLSGPDFDTLYVAAQRDGLRRLVALYRDYVQNGDDPALRALTVHALPRVRAWLAALRG